MILTCIDVVTCLIVFGRLGRSSLGYGSNRTSQDSHGLYSSRQSMGYGGGTFEIDGVAEYNQYVGVYESCRF